MTQALTCMSSFSLEKGGKSYLDTLQSIPMLTAQEEYDFATRYKEKGELAAAQQLVLAHLRYVARIAKQYMGYGLPLADLVQEGSIGLMKAVKRFDPKVGVRLVSFAVHWIKAEIHEFVIRNWRIVKMATTKAQRKLFFNLRASLQSSKSLTTAEAQEIAKDLNVPVKEVTAMEMRLKRHDETMDPGENEEGTALMSPAQYLAAPASLEPQHAVIAEEWEVSRQDQLKVALGGLDPRSLDIISARWLNTEKASLKELSDKYNISIARIGQIEKKAMEKMKDLIQE